MSALIEVDRFCAANALMLVHSFGQEHQRFDDYAAFAGLYGIEAELNKIHYAGKMSGKDLYLGWIVGEEKFLKR